MDSKVGINMWSLTAKGSRTPASHTTLVCKAPYQRLGLLKITWFFPKEHHVPKLHVWGSMLIVRAVVYQQGKIQMNVDIMISK